MVTIMEGCSKYCTFCVVPYIGTKYLNVSLVVSGVGNYLDIVIKNMMLDEVIYELHHTLSDNKFHIISIDENVLLENTALILKLKSDNSSLKLLAAEFLM